VNKEIYTQGRGFLNERLGCRGKKKNPVEDMTGDSKGKPYVKIPGINALEHGSSCEGNEIARKNYCTLFLKTIQRGFIVGKRDAGEKKSLLVNLAPRIHRDP